jgi:AcrR family transcriptional regulator
MRMTKYDEQSATTKANLREAFWILYSKDPASRVTVGQVCEKAGYNRGTFYLHYQDIYELRESIEAEVLEDMASCVGRALEKLSRSSSKLGKLAALTEVVRYYEKNRSYVEVFLRDNTNPHFIISLKTRLKPLWRKYLVKSTANRSEQEIDLILEYTLSGALFMISQWIENPGDVSAQSLGQLVYDTAIRDIQVRIEG